MTYAMTNHLRKSNTCNSPHGMTHFQRYECASCAARTSCFNMTVDADEAQRVGIIENEANTEVFPGQRYLNTLKAADRANAAAYDTITLELAHREAIAEDNERDARDWSAFKAQVATMKAAHVEADHVEALAEDADRTRYPDIYPGTRKSNPEQIDQYAERKAAEAADVREQSDMEE